MLTKLVRDSHVDDWKDTDFEQLVNNAINELIEQKHRIIDIKFSTNMSGDGRKSVYNALILYKQDKK
jgi:hypothetical protein